MSTSELPPRILEVHATNSKRAERWCWADVQHYLSRVAPIWPQRCCQVASLQLKTIVSKQLLYSAAVRPSAVLSKQDIPSKILIKVSPMVPAIRQPLANHLPTIGQPFANHWQTIRQPLSNHCPTIGQPLIAHLQAMATGSTQPTWGTQPTWSTQAARWHHQLHICSCYTHL